MVTRVSKGVFRKCVKVCYSLALIFLGYYLGTMQRSLDQGFISSPSMVDSGTMPKPEVQTLQVDQSSGLVEAQTAQEVQPAQEVHQKSHHEPQEGVTTPDPYFADQMRTDDAPEDSNSGDASLSPRSSDSDSDSDDAAIPLEAAQTEETNQLAEEFSKAQIEIEKDATEIETESGDTEKLKVHPAAYDVDDMVNDGLVVPGASKNKTHQLGAAADTCNFGDRTMFEKYVGEKNQNRIHQCNDLRMLVIVRSSPASQVERVPRIENSWALKRHRPANTKLLIFLDKPTIPETKKMANTGKVKHFFIDQCRPRFKAGHHHSCCKTAFSMWYANDFSKKNDTAWDWVYIVDDDTYVFLEHLRLHLCLEVRTTKPVVAGVPGCAAGGLGGMCGGGGFGFTREGMKKMVAGKSQEAFLNEFMKWCDKGGTWDDVAIGAMARHRKLDVIRLGGVEPWKMSPETQDVKVLDKKSTFGLALHSPGYASSPQIEGMDWISSPHFEVWY
eukprot:gnl/MRDRNA2_/MRDRNA2_78387_c0_seq2.p1 gnl/MRDRNA2_/MRDRNA2_78387_c0~~gnl/MRDRNA2_/MRDRNA2_78387_c0_seq2.p1  ORF type:complete len:499 (+),score=94.32 gnl/MRDRNA2_/MRDRNA2_78387_c0_seq2:53-1549(+)